MAERQELVGAIGELLRRQSGLALVLHRSVAERFGLNPTDLKCLDIAVTEAPVTAGRIAGLTGMSTSAVTALLDRLEKRGFVERYREPGDRRKVYVRSTGRHEQELAEIYRPLAEATDAVLSSFDPASLEVVKDLLGKLTEVSQAFLSSSRTGEPESGERGEDRQDRD
ncbi:MarR family winged helix-turn-helix transcriptional regulator [Cryptosporangium sp. NPDC051539]|uniref:MarR family winged helix-turn-helix transcriptional regulator n=1 Tax=Cryptosporangium sp. NPDC051539 TaxID=3363962 RepID=UPI0037A39BB1